MICKQCGCDFACRSLVNGKLRVFSSRKFCLACSPFGEHNTRANLDLSNTKVCPKCKLDLPKDKYYVRRKGETASYCKKCFNSYTVDRQRQTKEKCVEYMGGKCTSCGYDRCIGALEFHHKDPTQKDPAIRFGSTRISFDKLKRELDKCVILCANCHREEHAKMFSTTD